MPEFPFTSDTGTDTREVDPFGITLPNGTILSGWTQFRSDVSGRFTTLRIIDTDGTAITGELNVAPGAYDALDPTIVVLSDNKFLLLEAGFFSSGGEFGFNIYGHVITASGGTLTAGPLIDLSTPTGSTSNGNIEAVLLDNGFVAIVTDQTNDRVGNSDPFVVLAVVDQDLNVITDYTQVGERMQNSPSSINADANGDIVAIAWTQNAGGFSVPVLGQTVSVNSDGSLAAFVLDDHVLLGSDSAAYDGSYGLRDMKVLANGDILVIFSGQYTSSGDETLSDRLYGQVFSSDFTAPVAPAFRIDSVQSDYGVSAAQIVAFDGGGFLVAFSSIPNTTAAGSDYEVYYRVYDNTYAATGGIVRVTNNDDGLPYGSGAGQSNAGSQDILGAALLSGAGGDVTLLYERTVITEAFDYGDENVFGISLSNLDPNPVAVTPSLSIDDVTKVEGDSGTTSFVFTVSLSSPAPSGGVTFDIATANGTGTAGTDYVAKSLMSQTIPAGTSTYSFTVLVNGDATVEGDETFFVNVTNVVGATVTDGQGQGTITNDDVNTAPVANDDSYTTAEDTPLNVAASGVLGNDTDVDGNPLTASLVAGPSHGTLTLNANGSFSYTPAANYHGTDSFTYRANDGTANGNVATVDLTISSVNDAPVAITDSYSTQEDTPLSVSVGTGLLANDTDVDGDTLSAIVVNGPPSHGTLTFSSNGAFIYTPDANYNGSDSFTYIASDGTLSSGITTVNLTVSAVNDAPVNTVPGAQSTGEDTALVFSTANGNALSVSDIDVGGGTMTVTLAATHGTLTLGGTAGLVFATGDGSADATMTFDGTAAAINAALQGLTFDPAANYNGAADVTITTNDNGNTGTGGALQDADTVAITVASINDAPSGTDQTITMNEDGSRILTAADFGFGDTDGNSLSAVKVTTLPAAGTLTLNGVAVTAGQVVTAAQLAANQLVFAPAANASGTGYTSFTFQVQDDGGTANGGVDLDPSANTLTFDVTAVNDAPVNTVPGAQSTGEDTALVFSTANGNALSVSDIDVGGGTMTVTLAATHGTLTLGGTAGLVFATGDGSADATMTFDGTAAAINAALQGLTFDPAANYNGAADVTITTNDNGNTGTGGALQDADTVAITVASINDAPSGTDQTITMNEDGSRILTAADFGFGDTDGNSLSAVKVTTLPAAGTLTLNGVAVTAGQVVTAAQLAANQLVFAPAANASGTGYTSFTFQVQDDGGTANGGVDLDPSANTLTFDVTAVNDAPVNTVPGAQSTGEDTALVFSTANGNALSVSDIDVGGGTMTVTLAATHGTLTLGGTAGLVFATGDGSADATMTFDGTAAAINAALQGLTFDPAANYNGAADVTITTNDNGNTGTGGALQDADTVVVSVLSIDDPGVARDDRFVIAEGVTLTGSVFADNGFGVDFDIDSPLAVGAVDGSPSTVGRILLTDSGAGVLVNADGSFTYTPDGGSAQLAAPGSGASNTSLTDTFDYTLVGGGTATVTVIVNGSDGYDTLLGTGGNDTLRAGNFDDVLIGGLGADVLDGGAGSDTVSYAPDGAAVFVNLSLGQGYGNSAQGDTYISIENVIGSSGNDFIIGDPGVNRLDGGAGNDTIIGGVGPDVLIGGAGIDLLSYEDNSGTVFVDLLAGRGYNNAAEGDTYEGFENVIGGLFDDTLIGDHGANRLDGAMGADTLVGNGGADTFVFSYAPGATSPYGSPNVDTIFDFVSGEDKLEINASAFGGGLSGGALADGAFHLGSAAHDADDRFIYDQASGNLYFDADGSGGGAQVLVAILPNHNVIAATDFIIA